MQDSKATVALFSTRLRRDDDGAPNAYHPCGANYADPVCTGEYGLDHICSGVTMRDASGEVVPASEKPPGEKRNSRRCLEAFRAAQALNFPKCGQKKPCVAKWPGVVLVDRKVPVGSGLQQQTPLIRPSAPFRGYYISKTTLSRAEPSAPDGRSYLDARSIPYVVVPGASFLTDAPWAFGSTTRADLALVLAPRKEGVVRAVFAVVGDTGPPHSTGEVSSATLSLIRHLAWSPRPRPDEIPSKPVYPGEGTVILFRGASGYLDKWPSRNLSAKAIQEAGARLLAERGGLKQFEGCGSLPQNLERVEYATAWEPPPGQ